MLFFDLCCSLAADEADEAPLVEKVLASGKKVL